MLMDNKGNTNAANTERGVDFGVSEMLPKADRGGDNFGDFVNSREDLKPQIEMPGELVDNDNSAEISGEMQPNEQPALSLVDDDSLTDDEKKDKEIEGLLEKINVKLDAESLPKEYENAVSEIVRRNRENPSRLVKEMDIARWILMKKTFERKMGDGLHGRGLK